LLFTYPATKQSMRNSNAAEVVMLTLWHQIRPSDELRAERGARWYILDGVADFGVRVVVGLCALALSAIGSKPSEFPAVEPLPCHIRQSRQPQFVSTPPQLHTPHSSLVCLIPKCHGDHELFTTSNHVLDNFKLRRP
jgi:hypothetical protein